MLDRWALPVYPKQMSVHVSSSLRFFIVFDGRYLARCLCQPYALCNEQPVGKPSFAMVSDQD